MKQGAAGAVVATLALVLSLLVVSPATAASQVVGAAASTTGSNVEAATGPLADTGIVKTAVVGFNPENIISDALFYDGNAMSSAEIQSFLDSKIGRCENGKCLNVLSASISSRDAWYSQVTGDLVCSALQGGTMRVSELIYRVQVACGISAKAILVTLQKEQGLTTSSAPSDWNLRAAMGASCPDTEPCDPAYSGVGPQIVQGVRQLKIYKAGRFGKQPGVNFIGYNPSASCGGTNLNIQNYATAALYNYTPYQPNAASLAAGWGLGDGCSSYGNRNFFNYYTSWFGSTQGELLQVFQVSGTSERYLISGTSRWSLPTAEFAAQFTWISAVTNVSRDRLSGYSDKGVAKRAVRTTSGAVFLLDSGQRFRAIDDGQVSDFGWSRSSLPLADDAQVARYRDGGYLERVVRSGGQSWLIQGGAKRQVVDLGLLARFGISSSTTEISGSAAGEYAVAAPVLSAGVYRSGSSYSVQTDAGVFSLPATATGSGVAASARDLAPESFGFLSATKTLPLRITAAGRSYVLGDAGWLEVRAADYPSVLSFTAMSSGATAGIATLGRAMAPHFVRERSDATVFLVSGGTLVAASVTDQAWITRTYGVDPRVNVLADGVIAEASTPEGLAKTAAGVPYLLDGARAYRFRDCGQVADWGGNCATLRSVSDGQLAGYAMAGTLQYLVRTSEATWLIQGGQRRQVVDPAILGIYGIPSTSSAVSTATANQLPAGEPVLAAGVYSDGGGTYVDATEGGSYSLTKDQAVGAVVSSARALVPASFAKVPVKGVLPSKMRSDSRTFVLTREGWLDVDGGMYGDASLFADLPARAWTGIPVAATERRPHFVSSGSDEYLVSGGAAQLVAGAAERALITARYGVPPKVWPLVAGALTGVRLVYDPIVKDAAGSAYLIERDKRFSVSCGQVADFGRDCAGLKTVSASVIVGLSDGGVLAPLLRSVAGTVWLPQGGSRREVPDPRILAMYGIGTAATTVSDETLRLLKLGVPVLGAGVYDHGAGVVRVVTADGRSFELAAAQRVGAIVAGAWRISPESLALQPAEAALPNRIVAGGQRYILTTDGWLAVSSTAYGQLSFTDVGARATVGLASAGAEGRPHFVREQSASTVFLASGGLSPAGDEASRAWIAATYGVSSRVWVVPDGALG